MFEGFECTTQEEQDKFFKNFDFTLLKKNILSISNQELNLGSKLNIVVKFYQIFKLKGARAFQVLTTLEDVSKILDSKPSLHQN